MPYQRDLLPSFAGINTFARAPRAGFEDVGPGCVAVLGVPHDGSSTSRQGVRQGPRAIREASADFIYELQASESGALIDVISGRVLHLPQPSSLLDLGDLTLSPLDLPGNLDACRSAFSRIAESGACPVALGGDRFITFPLLEGVKAGSGRSLGLIRISAELSLADPDSQYGPDWSGASVRRILDAGVVEARNTVLVGTQGYIPYREWEYARSQGVTVITADSVKSEGPEATCAGRWKSQDRTATPSTSASTSALSTPATHPAPPKLWSVALFPATCSPSCESFPNSQRSPPLT